MFDTRSKNLSESMDWCVDALDKLDALSPDKAKPGEDMVRAWKRSIESKIVEPIPQEVQS